MPVLNPNYGNNYVVSGSGATFAIGADGIYDATAGGTVYYQYFKAAFGVSGAYTSVSSTDPLPVTVAGGLSATVTGFTGTITVQGLPGGNALPVSGTVSVTGVSGSPVYVSTQPNCYVEVTGGIPLLRTRDAVSIYGQSGNTYVQTQIVNSSGTIMGSTSNPMNVSFSGVTITGNIVSPIGVTNDSATSGLRIQGLSGGTSVPVNVGNTVGINDTAILSSLTGICGALGTLNNSIASISGVIPSSIKAGNLTVTSSATQLDATGFTCSDGVTVKSSSTNTTWIYVGNTGGITTSSTTTYVLDPGDEVKIKINNTSKIYLVSSVSTTAFYIAS
jgi:hypothetical protein